MAGIAPALGIPGRSDEKIIEAVCVYVSGTRDLKSRAIVRRLSEKGRVSLVEGHSVRPPTVFPHDQVRLSRTLSSFVVLIRTN